VDLPAAIGGGLGPIKYSYNSDGSLKWAQDRNGNQTNYAYDTSDNITEIKDALGNIVDYTYDSNNNLIIERHAKVNVDSYLTTNVIRYAYDSENHLRFIVSSDGRVTQNQYFSSGDLSSTIAYSYNQYDVSGLADTQSLSEVTLSTWAAGLL